MGFQIGNEFASVEALWSQFETVMGRENESQSAETQDSRAPNHQNEAESKGEGS